jgi:hypothetical protein
MVVGILSGDEGVGKTIQALGIAKTFPTARWGLLELKDEEKMMAVQTAGFEPETLFRMYPAGHELQGNEDPVETLKAVEQWRDSIFKCRPLPRTIVLDGVSDLREYAIDAWTIKDNAVRIAKGREPRKGIGEKNLAGWSEVNTIVKHILKPLVNLALKEHLNFIMTAQMRDKYMDGEIIGKEPAFKSYISYPVPCLFTLSNNGNGYSIDSTKDPLNPRWRETNIAKGTGLFDALIKHTLIEPPVRESNFMITYELYGEKKRAFVKAETVEDAKEEFTRGYPGCTFLEVVV